MAEEWLSVEDAARCLGVRPEVVYRAVREGRVAFRGSPVRVRRRGLEAALEAYRIEPGQLAHLDSNISRRAEPDKAPPLTGKGRPDRRYGRR